MTLREAISDDAAGIAAVQVASWRTTYPGIMPQEHLDALSISERTKNWQDILSRTDADHSHTFVAADETGEIVGFASGGGERAGDPDYLGEVYGLYLMHSYQRQGLGRRLVVTMARRLSKLGYASLLIWVNIDNHPARRFYEALGGAAARTGSRTINAVTYDDIGYGWGEAEFARLILR